MYEDGPEKVTEKLQTINRHIGVSWEDLKLDIMSIYFHVTSTDARPQHGLCSED